MPIFKSKTTETQLSQIQRGPSRVQSLGFASTEQAKGFLSSPPSHLFRVTADTSDRHPSGQPGHFLPQTSAYKAVSFRAWCHLPFGAERALSDCASRHVGFPRAPPLETKEYNQSSFGIDHLVMSGFRVFSFVVGRGCLL